MAKKEEEGKNRTVLIAVDGSEHSDRAFDCEYENGFVTRLNRLKSRGTHMHSRTRLQRNYQVISFKKELNCSRY